MDRDIQGTVYMWAGILAGGGAYKRVVTYFRVKILTLGRRIIH